MSWIIIAVLAGQLAVPVPPAHRHVAVPTAPHRALVPQAQRNVAEPTAPHRTPVPPARPSTKAAAPRPDAIVAPLPTTPHRPPLSRAVTPRWRPPFFGLTLLTLPPPRPVVPALVLHGPRNVKRIALTFDACPNHAANRFDDRVTHILLSTHTPATIFLSGRWMVRDQDHTRYLASFPQFELGNHSYSHPHLAGAPVKKIRYQLLTTERILYSLTGRHSTLFRPPYAEYDAQLVRVAAELGMRTVDCDLASGDPDPNINKTRLENWVVKKAHSGSIVIMHINRRGWHTAEALPDIIKRLRAEGYELVTVSDLMGYTPAPATHIMRAAAANP